MKTVTIRCEHIDTDIRLRISENNVCCIQCGLIQIVLSRSQAARVHRHCHCHSMMPTLPNNYERNRGQAIMTVDPSQLDLGGKYIASWRIG
jgi:hypothetical protein